MGSVRVVIVTAIYAIFKKNKKKAKFEETRHNAHRRIMKQQTTTYFKPRFSRVNDILIDKLILGY